MIPASLLRMRRSLDGPVSHRECPRRVRSCSCANFFFSQYGIPLTEYVIFANSIANRTGAWTTNALHHETTLANASYHAVVLPNVDTLYSEGILDLSGGDLIVTMLLLEEGCFYVWPFYDL
jgi:hypothetical protein